MNHFLFTVWFIELRVSTVVLPGASSLMLGEEVDKLIPLLQHHHWLYRYARDWTVVSVLNIHLQNWLTEDSITYSIITKQLF